MFSIQFSEDPKKRKAERFFLYVGGGAILVVVICLVLGLLIQLLWNSTIAAMFGLPVISYWQAIGLFILAKLLFGIGPHRARFDRHRKDRGRRPRRCDSKSEDVPVLADDGMFERYWQEEGKEAYEAFLATRREDQKGESEES